MSNREGENIGFEIIEVCQAAKPSLRVFRAKFSEITRRSVDRALETLGQPGLQFNRQIRVSLKPYPTHVWSFETNFYSMHH